MLASKSGLGKGTTMKFMDIAIKDLYQIFKDWKPAIFLVVAPIVFTLMFGFMFGGFSGPNGGGSDNRLPVQIKSQENTPITESLISFLESSDVIRVESSHPDATLTEYKQAVSDGDQAAVILIPAGFSQAIQEAGDVQLEVILDQSSTSGIAVQQEIESATNRLQTAASAASMTVQAYEEQAGPAIDSERNALYAAAFEEALQAWLMPPVTAVETRAAANSSQTTSEENAFAQSLPGMMAQFAIAGLIGAAEIIVQERKSGALERLMGTSVSRLEILAGHWLAMFMMILLQFMVLITFGQLFLRLNFFTAPFATLILAMASCAFVASLGLLIGILAKMPEQTAVYALIPMFIFAGLGGAWIPIDILGKSVQAVSRFTPVFWIMSGFKDILLRSAQFINILPAVGILLAFALLFFIPAAILFYRREK